MFQFEQQYLDRVGGLLCEENKKYLTLKALKNLKVLFQEFSRDFDPAEVFDLCKKYFKSEKITRKMLIEPLKVSSPGDFSEIFNFYRQDDDLTLINYEKLFHFLNLIQYIDRERFDKFMKDHSLQTIESLQQFLTNDGETDLSPTN